MDVAALFMTVSLVGVSLPTFLIGILLILVFAVLLGWLPTFGRGTVVQLGWWTTGFLTGAGLKALILPAITLGLFQMTLIMRLVRAEMLEVLRTDYIKFARARGLRDRAINFGHALKNTLVPVITIIGLQLGTSSPSRIVTETVFQWPGMGLLFIQSVAVADIPVMSAYLLLMAAVVRASSTWWSICSISRSIPGCASAARAAACAMSEVASGAALARLARTAISLYSFRRSPVAIVCAAVVADLRGRRRLRALARAA